MRIVENDEKTRKLCHIFSLLDERDHEHVFSILQALLVVKLQADSKMAPGNSLVNITENEKPSTEG